jgi:hypothetical protein
VLLYGSEQHQTAPQLQRNCETRLRGTQWSHLLTCGDLNDHRPLLQSARAAWSPQRASQAKESSTSEPAPAYAGKHQEKPCNLQTSPGGRASPVDTLRVSSAPTDRRPVPGWGSHPSDQAPTARRTTMEAAWSPGGSQQRQVRGRSEVIA